MDDKIKLIIMGVGGFLVTFALSITVFYFILVPGDESAAQQTPQAPAADGAQAQAARRMRAAAEERVPGGEVLAYADVLGEEIPLEADVHGYEWARWGMSLQEVLTQLGERGVTDTVVYHPEGTDFISVTALNPDRRRNKVEYRFYNRQLFHIEVYYSDFFRNNSYDALLLEKMREYGTPYEQYATVNEMGEIILHSKWDTEESLIELVARPGGNYSLFLDNQLSIIQFEELRKSEERLSF